MPKRALLVPITAHTVSPPPTATQLGLPTTTPPRLWKPVEVDVVGLKLIPNRELSVPFTAQTTLSDPVGAQLGLPTMIPPRGRNCAEASAGSPSTAQVPRRQ